MNQKTSAREIPYLAQRSRKGSITGVQILGVGSYVPDIRVRNEDLASLGYDAEWIVQRTGILERRHAPPEMATSDLAVEAARRCLADAGVDAGEVDLVLLGTYTPDMTMPAAASLVQEKLKLCAPAMDIQAACTSFMFALLTGMQFVASGCAKRPLVIGADCNSRVCNPADVKTYPIFGDGAGAVVLGPGDRSQGFIAFSYGSDGAGFDLLYRPMGGSRCPTNQQGTLNGEQYVVMEGRPVFKWAIRMLNQTVHDVLEMADLTLADISLVIFHQANMRIIQAAAETIGIPSEKLYNNLDRYGNTSSASIPICLDEAVREGRIRKGDLVLLSGFGGGLSWATGILRW
uniref:Beta-ketoacyl-[acyl-carrier-protein] synthase III n=1 Tax=uncultured Planctomycetota bacterium TaxID=120965 RepID=H5SAT4_9BACT|nr:3-oxoacyl-[acyl-carrier-protein] synthase III [uncultured Planctomycetota bacterium]